MQKVKLFIKAPTSKLSTFYFKFTWFVIIYEKYMKVL